MRGVVPIVIYEDMLKQPDLVAQLPRPKRPKTLLVVLSQEEVIRLFRAVDNFKHSARHRSETRKVRLTLGTTLQNLFSSWMALNLVGDIPRSLPRG